MFTRLFRRLMRLRIRIPNLGAIVRTVVQKIARFFVQTGLSKLFALFTFLLFDWMAAFLYHLASLLFSPQKVKQLKERRKQL